jgi:hypothetical protein
LGYGYITMLTPATQIAGAQIANLGAAWHWPGSQVWGCPINIWNGSSWAFQHAIITVAGVITLQEEATINCTRIYFGPAIWQRNVN